MIKKIRRKYPNAKDMWLIDEKGMRQITTYTIVETAKRLAHERAKELGAKIK